jgi:hypothetical protein
MRNRLRLMMGATALLYLGPLLAGLAGFGWALLPAFTAIFVLWLIVLRPHQWPRRPADWTGAVALRAAGHVLVQVLLVAVCFGVGRGIGGVLGVTPALPLALPLALSFLAIPLCRLVWDPWKAAELDVFLDDAIRRIEDPDYRPGADPEAEARAEAAIAAVLDLPEDAPDATALAAVAAALPEGDFALDPLIFALDRAGPTRTAGRRGLILWATDPDRARDAMGLNLPDYAFTVTWTNPDLLALFVARARPLIDADPALWIDFPDGKELHFAIDDTNPPALNAALRALADALDQAMPAEYRSGAGAN